MKESVSSVKRRAFLKLSPEERSKILEEQADQIAKHYEDGPTWREPQGGDPIEYEQPKPKKGAKFGKLTSTQRGDLKLRNSDLLLF